MELGGSKLNSIAISAFKRVKDIAAMCVGSSDLKRRGK